jgi:UDP-N-acetylglucosamine 4-epimerase
METIGLRYFNVFGPKQSPNGEYAAVIPLFIKAIKELKPATINGDGETTRDFTFVENVIQANIKAMLIENKKAVNQIYNVACGEFISLNQLWLIINKIAKTNIQPTYGQNRSGDVRNSLANIEKVIFFLDYEPSIKIEQGLLNLMK